MIRSQKTPSRGRGRPSRTMTTRQHTIPSTSGSGDQHPVAPNIRNDQEGNEARSQQRTLSLSPLPGRRCSSTPPVHHTSTRRLVYRQPQQLPRHVGHDEETPLAGALDRASETRAGDSFYHHEGSDNRWKPHPCHARRIRTWHHLTQHHHRCNSGEPVWLTGQLSSGPSEPQYHCFPHSPARITRTLTPSSGTVRNISRIRQRKYRSGHGWPVAL